jgi:hypothetical protein
MGNLEFPVDHIPPAEAPAPETEAVADSTETTGVFARLTDYLMVQLPADATPKDVMDAQIEMDTWFDGPMENT